MSKELIDLCRAASKNISAGEKIINNRNSLYENVQKKMPDPSTQLEILHMLYESTKWLQLGADTQIQVHPLDIIGMAMAVLLYQLQYIFCFSKLLTKKR